MERLSDFQKSSTKMISQPNQLALWETDINSLVLLTMMKVYQTLIVPITIIWNFTVNFNINSLYLESDEETVGPQKVVASKKTPATIEQGKFIPLKTKSGDNQHLA